MICGKCRVICGEICPCCGKTKYVREAEPNEAAFLITLSHIKAMFVEPILQESGVVYNRVGTLGAGLTARWGSAGEMYRYFVPYSELAHAREAIEAIFGEDEEIMRALNEYNSEND